MEKYVGALSLTLLLAMVLIRVRLMKRKGIQAMHFGNIDKTDFLIPPFALFYFYIVFAAAFDWPTVATHRFFQSGLAAGAGVFCCVSGLVLLFLSLVSFGKSFRIGIDQDDPDKLVTTGVFGFSRNPMYVAFWFVLLGQFLLFSNLIPLVYLAAATLLFHRQVLREEDSMRRRYGQEYSDYRDRVRRYL
ncbi:MAG: isoprenylcysteine carboxylmethyltransferase family protein [Terracidiphilus sp.]